MTKKDLKKLRDQLPRGFGKTISEKTGYHFNTVYMVLKGELDNQEVIEAAIELARAENERKKQLQQKIKTLK